MDAIPAHEDKPRRTLKVLIPFDATREQIEEAVELINGSVPERPKPIVGPEGQ